MLRPRPSSSRLVLVPRNLLGWTLIVVGIALSIPGVPGQGLLTGFCGLLPADVPGKRRFLAWILRRPKIGRLVNAWRVCLGREPLLLP